MTKPFHDESIAIATHARQRSPSALVWRAIGPGLLFSGAAIGVSHLVQSTRAGAMFGLGLVGVIILINVLKYPAFRFGLDYGHATRRSLLSGYRKLGLWAPILFCIVIAPAAPIVIAAVAATTAGIVKTVFGTTLSIPILASALLAGSAALAVFGGYGWLDRVNRVLLAFLVVSTLATTVMVLPRVNWGTLGDFAWAGDPAALLFVVALAGFMPNPLDISVSQSLWADEAEKRLGDTGGSSLQEARTAFFSAYVLTALLAVCFCIMGAGVMHGEGIPLAPDAAGFAAQIIDLYRAILGDAAAVLASIAALSVMLTTILIAVDIYGRNFASAYAEIAGTNDPVHRRWAYVATVVVAGGGAIAALFLLLSDFKRFIDLATTAAFLSAPIVATLNHIVLTRGDVPEHARPGRGIRWLSLAAIILMTALAVTFLVLTFGR